ncbi:MAG TPA: hypothetical protein VGL22_02130 [Terracidiphilus sp.]
MFSFRRVALLLALGLPAAHFALSQDSTSSSSSAQQPAQSQDQSQPDQGQQTTNQPAVNVQGRIRARRDQRRAAAIRDTYSHLYEMQLGMGYMRFTPGKDLQRTTFYSWNVDFTRFYGERLGVDLNGRGNYGTTFVGVNPYNVTKPSISMYSVMLGPQYRFYIHPKYAVSGRVLGGWARGNFSGDTNGFGSTTLGMWPDGNTFGINAAVMGEYNVSPSLALRLAPEYNFSGFGSSVQYSAGFTTGFVFRFGKQ